MECFPVCRAVFYDFEPSYMVALKVGGDQRPGKYRRGITYRGRVVACPVIAVTGKGHNDEFLSAVCSNLPLYVGVYPECPVRTRVGRSGGIDDIGYTIGYSRGS